jgi:hypothetical protein
MPSFLLAEQGDSRYPQDSDQPPPLLERTRREALGYRKAEIK